jgi:hypothetical protein
MLSSSASPLWLSPSQLSPPLTSARPPLLPYPRHGSGQREMATHPDAARLPSLTDPAEGGRREGGGRGCSSPSLPPRSYREGGGGGRRAMTRRRADGAEGGDGGHWRPGGAPAARRVEVAATGSVEARND